MCSLQKSKSYVGMHVGIVRKIDQLQTHIANCDWAYDAAGYHFAGHRRHVQPLLLWKSSMSDVARASRNKKTCK